ncbi:MAG: phycobilisome rod-core linker polypeptide [Prosthecobacter sp.]|nr:phycobilisome rod-core linker polypeptide [Prosthecobacter sp.]
MKKIVFALLVFCAVLPAAGQDCSAIFENGIYDIRSSESGSESEVAFSQWFCDKKFSTASESDSFGSSLAFPLKGLPVKLGFDSDSQQYSQWQSSFCASVKKDQSLKNRVKYHMQTINKDIVEAFNKCLDSRGLHVWLERTHDPREVILALHWNSYDTEHAPVTKPKEFSASPNFRCGDIPTTVSNSTHRVRCTRTDDKAVSAVINTSPGPIIGSGKLTLPEIYRPAIEQPPPPHPRCVDATTVITALYKLILERPADRSALTYRVAALTNNQMSVREMVLDIVRSDEHVRDFAQNKPGVEQVANLYKHVLVRKGEADGIAHNVVVLDNTNYHHLAKEFVNSPEYAIRFGSRTVPGEPVTMKYCN